MAVNEKIQTGRKFRKLIAEDSRLWMRISFWTKASDVEFDDNETAETKFADMSSRITDLTMSFRDGVNKIFNCLKGLGFTPETNSPDGICSAIQNVHSSRYTNGYNAGRLQGQEDVKANPGGYGVSTGISPGQFQMYSSREDFDESATTLVVPHNGTCNLKFEIFAAYSKPANNNTLTVTVLQNGTAIAYEEYTDRDITSDTGPYTWNKTISISYCTKGETLTFKINKRGSDASWIVGLY